MSIPGTVRIAVGQGTSAVRHVCVELISYPLSMSIPGTVRIAVGHGTSAVRHVCVELISYPLSMSIPGTVRIAVGHGTSAVRHVCVWYDRPLRVQGPFPRGHEFYVPGRQSLHLLPVCDARARGM